MGRSLIIRIPLGLAGLGVGLGLGLSRNADPAQALAALPAIMSLIGLSGLIQVALSLAYEVYFLSTRARHRGKWRWGLKSPARTAARYRRARRRAVFRQMA